MKVVLGWNIHFSIWVSSLTVAVYVALGGLFSAIFNEVLQFFLIWLGALLIPILGLVETGGWNGLVARIHQNFPARRLHAPVADPGPLHRQPHGHPLDRHRLRPGLGDFLRLLDHRFPGGAARPCRQGHSRRQDGAHHRLLFQDGRALHRDPAGIAGLGAAALQAGSGKRRGRPASTVTTRCCR